MVDFRQTPKPRNYLARREQWRLLMLVMSLGLVALLMNEVRDPANVARIAALFEESAADAAGSQPEETAVDNRLTPRTEDRIPDAFISPADIELDETTDTSGRYFPGVRPQLLAAIRDDTTFRYQEQGAWFNLLGVLKKTDAATLRKASTGRASFAQLFKQSDDYRGELVTLVGTIRRTEPMTAPKNDQGIQRYHRLVLQPADNRTSPIVIYCLALSEAFPTGMEISQEVELTGFFFKRWAYKARDSLRTTPIVLARTVDWHRAEPLGGSAPTDAVSLALMFGVAAVFAVVAVFYIFTRTKSDRTEAPKNVQLP